MPFFLMCIFLSTNYTNHTNYDFSPEARDQTADLFHPKMHEGWNAAHLSIQARHLVKTFLGDKNFHQLL